MSSEWTQTTLGDVCLKITDGAHASPKSVAVGKPMASVKDMTRFGIDLSSARLISVADFESLVKQGCRPEIGDVLIAKDGNSALDTVCNVKSFLDAVLLSSVAILRPNPEKIDADFLKFYLSSSDVVEYLKSTFISGAAIPRVVLRDFKKAGINIPPLSIQKEIATVLNAIEDRIFILRETNKTLEFIAQAIFKSWFVDFDPVHAKAKGLAPEGMDEATAALFPDSFEETELGMVPKGWCYGHVKDLGDVVCGKTPPTANLEYYGDDIPFVTIPDLHNNLVITSTAKKLSNLGANFQIKKYLPEGAICVSCIATPGLVARVSELSQTNQQINSVIPKDVWGSSFSLFALRHISSDVVVGGSGGSVLHNMNKSTFECLPVLLPQYDLVNRFNNLIEPIVDKVTNNQRQITLLNQLRDTLLPRLISGKLRIEEAQEMVESV
jgi:type I restriction enzyme S subunit